MADGAAEASVGSATLGNHKWAMKSLVSPADKTLRPPRAHPWPPVGSDWPCVIQSASQLAGKLSPRPAQSRTGKGHVEGCVHPSLILQRTCSSVHETALSWCGARALNAAEGIAQTSSSSPGSPRNAKRQAPSQTFLLTVAAGGPYSHSDKASR